MVHVTEKFRIDLALETAGLRLSQYPYKSSSGLCPLLDSFLDSIWRSLADLGGRIAAVAPDLMSSRFSLAGGSRVVSRSSEIHYD